MIITLPSKAVTNPASPRPNINKANWEKFNEVVEGELNNIVITNNMITGEIEL